MEEERVEQTPPPPPPSYIHIETNDFLHRRHKRQKEEDIAVCECQYNLLDPDSACGDRCLNVLTSTECTPGYCRCGVYCKNQRFQKSQYAATRLVKTEGRGWGLLADENIMAGQFVMEYCGEVISWKEAKRRSQAYENQDLTDAYIIYLNADESIDATKKGSLARFINHSQPNCETRKWNVLGEVRVGIFAKQDIPIGIELSYDYNFEWFGGAMVRCLCGAGSCSGFLGAKSRGFQEATYLWEDDDDRFSVENVPLYDSTDDEPTSIPKDILLIKDEPFTQDGSNNSIQNTENPIIASSSEFTPMNVEPLVASSNEFTPMNVEPLNASSNEFTPMTIEPLNAIPMGVDFTQNGSIECGAQYAEDALQNSTCEVANLQSQSAPRGNNHTELVAVKRRPALRGGKAKRGMHKQLNVAGICDRFASEVAREEILYCEEMKNQAAAQIDGLYDEIRPAIEEHERDSQDSVATSLAEKWIEASCCKYKADFDLYASIIKNLASTPLRSKEDAASKDQNGVMISRVMGKSEHGNLLVSLSDGLPHYSLAAAVGLAIGVAGLCKALHSSLVTPCVPQNKLFSNSERLYYVGGLKNLGNNCFLNVILQALASCDGFVSSLDNLLGSEDVLPEEKSERMPLIFALSSLIKDLSVVRDERTELSPHRVMDALSFYDASEAFHHLLTSLRDEFSRCYVPNRSSLADITLFPSKVYSQREGNQPECKRWKQNLFGPFDGTIGSILSCRNCSSVLSLDFENFYCLPLSPVAGINGDIINGCSLLDCLEHFTVLEHLDNYRCDRCWHNVAAKYLSLKSDVDEEKINKLRTCVDYDTCSCRHIFSPEEMTCSISSQATKQLAITHFPKGHISFPLLLDLSPFAGGALIPGQGPKPSGMNMQRHGQQTLHLWRQLNAEMPVNMFPAATDRDSSSHHCDDESINTLGRSLYVGNRDADSKFLSSSSLTNKLYGLSSVVEHYGVCGGGHYAAYRRVTPNSDSNEPVQSLASSSKEWLYVSDDYVSHVSEGEVLAAEATLLFYEML
uniref:Ubiquitinyl hydrolase 1 n=1 Tax=Oryza punctata TaxID=4537 RepID=A0A0E0KQQ1_ORYPU